MLVVVPAGVDAHHQLKVSGQGDAGRRGGVNGDIRVRLSISPHPQFTRDGNDVHVTVPVPMHMAVLGGSVSVPTLTGEATLKVDAGTQPGEKRVMRGKGIKDVSRPSNVGSQFVTFNVQIPTQLTEAQRLAMNSFAQPQQTSSAAVSSSTSAPSSASSSSTPSSSSSTSSSLFSSLFGVSKDRGGGAERQEGSKGDKKQHSKS